MAQPPPTALRYLVLLAAVALLATAVCSKTERATSAPPTPPAPVTVQPIASDAELTDPTFDAGAAPTTMQQAADPPQAAEPPPVANPPANAAGKGNSKGNRVDDKTVFPATKSGGMF